MDKQWFSLVYVIFEREPFRPDDWEKGLAALVRCYVDIRPQDSLQPKFSDVFVQENAKISSHVFDEPYFHDIFRLDLIPNDDMAFVRVRIVEALVRALKIQGYYRTEADAPHAWIVDRGPIRIFRLSCKNFEVRKDDSENSETIRGLAIGVIYW